MLKVALVGCGFMGKMHGNVYRSLPNADLVAAVDHHPGRLNAYCEEFGCAGFTTLDEALASHVDIVDICLPTYLHREFTVAAARAGKHVFCEKPMALNVAAAETMLSECEASGVQLMIGHCIRFWPEYALLKRINDDARLGQMLSVNLTRYGEFPTWSSDNWLADESKSGGGALDMHIHDTDYAHYLLGEPDEISSFGTRDERGVGQIFTTLRYADGAIAHLEGGWNLPAGTPFKMSFRAIFERGAVIMDGGPMTIYSQGEEPYSPEFPRMEASGGGNISDLGGYYHELDHFVSRIEAGRPLDIAPPQSSLRSLETALREIEQVKSA